MMQQFKKINGSRLKVKILMGFKRFFKTTLYCYYIKSRRYQFEEIFPIQVASSICQLSEIKCDDSFLKIAIERFNSGHRLFYCCDNGILIAYGWLTECLTSYYAWEIANDIQFPQSVDVLCDFYVDPNYRRRGIYKSLLHFIINDCTEKKLLSIYAESTNVPSIKAIKSCGFRFVSKLTHFSNKIKEES